MSNENALSYIGCSGYVPDDMTAFVIRVDDVMARGDARPHQLAASNFSSLRPCNTWSMSYTSGAR